MEKKRKKEEIHEPVLVKEVLRTFKVKDKKGLKIIDATLGTGGHTLELVNNGAQVLGIELDPEILEVAKKRLKGAKNYKLFLGNFKDIDSIAADFGLGNVDGVLFDLGVSNLQLRDRFRGFSFEYPSADLDMRISSRVQGIKAMDLVNVLRKDQLERLFLQVLDYSEAKKIAQRIIERRISRPFEKVADFLEVSKVARVNKRNNPSTRAFLALRIAVNSELENLEVALPKSFSILKKGGRLCVISFHSSEDRIVKNYFRSLVQKEKGFLVTKKVIRPTLSDVQKNKRSRSAKLRAVEKL